MPRRGRTARSSFALLMVVTAVGAGLGVVRAAPAAAHSYADPALTTVLDGVQPAGLPDQVLVTVQPSVVDELAVSNPTTIPLDVLAAGGEPIVRVDSTGVLANLASPDWYLTSNPEGGSVPPADVLRDGGRVAPRWARVSRTGIWAEFDPRLHPPAVVTPAQRRAGRDLVVATWRIPLRYGSTSFAATGHVSFTPIRGGFVTAVTSAPIGLRASALQGELPGLLLQVPAERTVIVSGVDGQPFLRFAGSTVEANTASSSWQADRRARGLDAPAVSGLHWQQVGSGGSFSWLDSRLRFPADLPPPAVLAQPIATIVRSWTVPLTVDGAAAAVRGTDTWVPRAVGTRAVAAAARSRGPSRRGALLLAGGSTVLLVALGTTWARRRRRRRLAR